MSRPKIVFLDVDGTVIDYSQKLPASARKAIDAARANGHRMILCTGCCRGELGHRELPEVDGLIGGNGAFAEYGGRLILDHRLSAEEQRAIVDWAERRGLSYYMETNTAMFCNPAMLDQGRRQMTHLLCASGMAEAAAAAMVDRFLGEYVPLQGAALYRNDVYKIDYLLRSMDDFEDAKAAFPALEANTWGSGGPTQLFGDLGPAGVTKQNAIRVLLEYLQVAPQDAIAFGDTRIDISMFALCGTSVAMGSGDEACKAAATFVTDGVNEDGLAHAFARLGLI